jgi:hypothetical protein
MMLTVQICSFIYSNADLVVYWQEVANASDMGRKERPVVSCSMKE